MAERVPGRAAAVRTAVGRHGEDVAVAHLLEQGWEVVERGWRARPTAAGGARGEVDVVAWDGPVLVVCEVKTRQEGGFVHPLEAVGWRKAARLRRLAAAFLAEHPALRPREVRVDLVAVVLPRRGAARVEHVRGVA